MRTPNSAGVTDSLKSWKNSASPHPGNVFLTDDGRIALLDLGMVGHTTPGMQENLLKLLLAIGESKSDEAAELVIRISETTEGFGETEFRSRIGQLMASRQDEGLKQINVGRSLLEVAKNAADNGLFVPSELTLLGKTLLQLDEVGKILDPAFDPNASIRRNVGQLMSQRMGKNATQGSLFSSLLEVKDFVGGLPSRLNRIMDAVANQELEVKVKAVDAKLMMEGFQKNCQSHHGGHRPRRADHGSVPPDAGPNQLSNFWLSGSGHGLLSGRSGGRIPVGHQHSGSRSERPKETAGLTRSQSHEEQHLPRRSGSRHQLVTKDVRPAVRKTMRPKTKMLLAMLMAMLVGGLLTLAIGDQILLPASAVPGWPPEVPLPIDPE